MRQVTQRILPVIAAVVISLCGCNDKPSPDNAPSPTTPTAGDAVPQALTLIVEAESMARDGSFVVAKSEDASRASMMQIPGQAACCKITGGATPKPVGTLKTDITLDGTRTVNIWLRVKWLGTCSNSFSVTLPNGMKKTVTSSTYNSWLWLPVIKNLELKAGTHTVSVAAREFGTYLDQIFITDDLQRTPRGIEADFSEFEEK